MFNQIFTTRDMDDLRRILYGHSASLTLYSVTPADGEQEIRKIFSGWHVARKLRMPSRDVDGAITVMLSKGIDVSLTELRDNAVIAIQLGRDEEVKRYRVAEVTETQQLGGGYVLHCEPSNNPV